MNIEKIEKIEELFKKGEIDEINVIIKNSEQNEIDHLFYSFIEDDKLDMVNLFSKFVNESTIHYGIAFSIEKNNMPIFKLLENNMHELSKNRFIKLSVEARRKDFLNLFINNNSLSINFLNDLLKNSLTNGFDDGIKILIPRCDFNRSEIESEFNQSLLTSVAYGYLSSFELVVNKLNKDQISKLKSKLENNLDLVKEKIHSIYSAKEEHYIKAFEIISDIMFKFEVKEKLNNRLCSETSKSKQKSKI